MAKRITLRFPARCADCGANLEPGDTARWYGKGRVYGINCHQQSKMVWYGGERMKASKAPGGHCEDAPCCGCCGPGSDDPAYQPYEPEDNY